MSQQARKVGEPTEEQETPKRPMRALVVKKEGLALLGPLFDEFIATGHAGMGEEEFTQMCLYGVGSPGFRLWVVVEGKDPLAFITAQLQPGIRGPHAFIAACYVRPGSGPEPLRLLAQRVAAWARASAVVGVLAKTRRGDSEGLTEPKAWEALGFRYESTLMMYDMEGYDGR